MDPFCLFRSIGCCKDPPVEIAQPEWWKNVNYGSPADPFDLMQTANEVHCIPRTPPSYHSSSSSSSSFFPPTSTKNNYSQKNRSSNHPRDEISFKPQPSLTSSSSSDPSTVAASSGYSSSSSAIRSSNLIDDPSDNQTFKSNKNICILSTFPSMSTIATAGDV